MSNHYEVLGVNKKASKIEIKKAYKKMANKFHPDKNKGDKVSEEKFKEVKDAYETLHNDSKRMMYDLSLSNHEPNKRTHDSYQGFKDFKFDGFDTENNPFEDMMKNYRKQNTKKKSVEIDLFVDINVAFNGGDDYIENNKTKLKVKIPPQTLNNTKLRVKNKGENIILTIKYKPSEFWFFENDDLILRKQIPVEILLVGGSVETKLLNKTINLKINSCSQNKSRMRIPKHGFKNKDLFIELNALIPKSLNNSQIENIKKAFS